MFFHKTMSCHIFHALCDTALYPVVFDSGNQWKPLIAPLVINTLKKAFSIHHHQQIFISQMLHCSLRFCDINRPKWHEVKRQVLQMVVEGKKESLFLVFQPFFELPCLRPWSICYLYSTTFITSNAIRCTDLVSCYLSQWKQAEWRNLFFLCLPLCVSFLS